MRAAISLYASPFARSLRTSHSLTVKGLAAGEGGGLGEGLGIPGGYTRTVTKRLFIEASHALNEARPQRKIRSYVMLNALRHSLLLSGKQNIQARFKELRRAEKNQNLPPRSISTGTRIGRSRKALAIGRARNHVRHRERVEFSDFVSLCGESCLHLFGQ